VGDDLGEALILDRFGDGAVTVQEGFSTVVASSGSVGGGVVDLRDDEAYLHESGAPYGRRTDDVWNHRFYSEVRRSYFVPPPV
jgi:hypothetical protein